MTCGNCGREGHNRRTCPKKEKRRKGEKKHKHHHKKEKQDRDKKRESKKRRESTGDKRAAKRSKKESTPEAQQHEQHGGEISAPLRKGTIQTSQAQPRFADLDAWHAAYVADVDAQLQKLGPVDPLVSVAERGGTGVSASERTQTDPVDWARAVVTHMLQARRAAPLPPPIVAPGQPLPVSAWDAVCTMSPESPEGLSAGSSAGPASRGSDSESSSDSSSSDSDEFEDGMNRAFEFLVRAGCDVPALATFMTYWSNGFGFSDREGEKRQRDYLEIDKDVREGVRRAADQNWSESMRQGDISRGAEEAPLSDAFRQRLGDDTFQDWMKPEPDFHNMSSNRIRDYFREVKREKDAKGFDRQRQIRARRDHVLRVRFQVYLEAVRAAGFVCRECHLAPVPPCKFLDRSDSLYDEPPAPLDGDLFSPRFDSCSFCHGRICRDCEWNIRCYRGMHGLCSGCVRMDGKTYVCSGKNLGEISQCGCCTSGQCFSSESGECCDDHINGECGCPRS
jgi:hypothetical protein